MPDSRRLLAVNCASSLATEARRSSKVIISRPVVHAYSRSASVRAKEGTYNVCAYLTPAGHGSNTRARASATYYVLVGAY